MVMLQKLAKKPAALWGLAGLLACLAGVAWAYYWRVFYYLDSRVSPAIVTAGCVLACLAAVAAAGVLHYGLRSFTAKATACIAVCGLLFAFANPPMQTPDESEHFLRTYAISMGRFDFDAERGYPDDVAALYNAFPGAWVNAHTSAGAVENETTGETKVYDTAGYALKQYGEDGRVESVADSFDEYLNTPDTTPVSEPVSFLVLPFLPGAIGMFVARLLGFGALGCLYGGRIANLAVYTVLCWLALRRAEKFRPAFVCVMLLPLSLWMGASLSYDAALLGCYYLMLAQLTRRTWTTRDAAVYAAACVWVNVAKPYINLLWAFLPLMLLREAFCARGRRWHWTAGMLAASLAVTRLVEWYGVAFRANYGEIGRMGGSDVNQLEQLLFILKNPLRYLAVLLGTLYENDFFVGQLGLFGWKDLPITLLSLTGPVLLLTGAVLSAGKGQSITRRRTVSLAVFAAVYAVGMMTAMYITYTPVSMVRIVGLQTRYFLPVLLLAAMLLAVPLRRTLSAGMTPARAERWALRIFVPCAAIGALLLFQHYFIGPIATIPA